MPRRLLILIASAAGAAAVAAQESRPGGRTEPVPAGGPAAEPPRLLALVVVDQLSRETYDAARPWFGPDGFLRLEREGTRSTRCAYEHACTETAPGHAVLGTGAPPSVHGIPANDWPDPATGALVDCVLDPTLAAVGPPPEARIPGATWSRLRAPTFGDALKAARPEARVLGFALKARSALLTVGPSADLAAWCDYGAGWWTTSPAARAAPPPFLAAFNAADPVERGAARRWDRGGPDAAFADLGPDAAPWERGPDGRNAFPHSGAAPAGASRAERALAAVTTPFGNELVLEATAEALRVYRAGADDVPDMLFVGFSAVDLVGHLYGPHSHEARAMLLATDAQVARLLRMLDDAAGRGRYLVALTSDHGVGPVPEEAVRRGVKAGRVDVRRLRAAAESALAARYGDPAPERWTLAQEGGFLVLNGARLEARKIDRAAAQDAAAAAVARTAGVRAAYAVARLLRDPAPDEVAARVRRTLPVATAPDVYVVPEPFHLFSRNPASHGTPWAYDREVPLLLAGPGVRAGVVIDAPTSPACLAATFAAFAGVACPSGAGPAAPLDGSSR
ncbi:MAG TPA: alkaline phosphatase family protein [Planctomycetota bacterium]|nr:alkaline phosphatase family protein [Planctomycetota bacterium]